MKYFQNFREALPLSLLIATCLTLFFNSCNTTEPLPPPPPPVPIDATFLSISKRNGFDKLFDNFNKAIQTSIDSNKKLGDAGLPYEIIRIPVVVHVILNNGLPTITKTQIERQIAILNRDFRRGDTTRIKQLPEIFHLLAADARIEFALAKSTIEGKPTEGILYKNSTRTTPFTFDPLSDNPFERNPVKFDTTGGSDAWPAEFFLNIWICNLAQPFGRGYASLPLDLEGMLAEDGIVVNAADFEKERTLTTLTAKWLGLADIWGMGLQVESDEVDDTPTQETSNNSCPNYPIHNSPTSPYGDMFVNFMDATDDKCRVMFSAGQVDRIRAVIETNRNNLSDAIMYTLAPPPESDCKGRFLTHYDYYVKDSTNDVGSEPSTISAILKNSPSIWVNAGAGTSHQNPIIIGGPKYIWVRVHERCEDLNTNDSIYVYFAQASTVLEWNSNNWTEVKFSTGTPVRYKIRETAKTAGIRLFKFNWENMPNVPNTYSIIASITPSCPSCADTTLSGYVGRYNNTAWKNVGTALPLTNDSLSKSVSIKINNPFGYNVHKRLIFNKLAGEASVLDFGTLTISNDTLIQLWLKSGRKGKGIALNNNQLLIQEKDAYIDLDIPPGTSMPTTFTFKRSTQASKQRNIYVLNLEQLSSNDGNNYHPEGGFMFVVKTEHTNDFPPAPDLPPATGGLNGKTLAGLAGLLGLLAILWTQRKKIFGLKGN